MGTRSLTVIRDENEEIAVLYRQMDGYPTGHGAELKAFLEPIAIVNGMGGTPNKIANGMNCLAAQLVAHFKDGAGGFYLYPAGTRNRGEEWIYIVSPGLGKDTGLRLEVLAGDVTFFGFPGTKQSNMPCLFDGAVSLFDPAATQETRNQLEIQNDFIESQKSK